MGKKKTKEKVESKVEERENLVQSKAVNLGKDPKILAKEKKALEKAEKEKKKKLEKEKEELAKRVKEQEKRAKEQAKKDAKLKKKEEERLKKLAKKENSTGCFGGPKKSKAKKSAQDDSSQKAKDTDQKAVEPPKIPRINASTVNKQQTGPTTGGRQLNMPHADVPKPEDVKIDLHNVAKDNVVNITNSFQQSTPLVNSSVPDRDLTDPISPISNQVNVSKDAQTTPVRSYENKPRQTGSLPPNLPPIDSPESIKFQKNMSLGRDTLDIRRKEFFRDFFLESRSIQCGCGNLVHQAETEFYTITMATELSALVSRLEKVVSRVENISIGMPSGAGHGGGDSIIETLSPAVIAFDELVGESFQEYLKLSKQIGGDVASQADLVKNAFSVQRDFILMASKSMEPDQSTLKDLLSPTSMSIQKIQDHRDKNRTSTYFNHLSSISESIPALGWITVKPAPSPYIKEMVDASQFYTNRVLKDWKDKSKTHVDWTKAWVSTLAQLQQYVKQHHTTGIVWNPTGGKASFRSGGGPPPPPPNMPPPPPPMVNIPNLDSGVDVDRSALFAEINKGDAVTKGLKKVTSEMQTHKNPNLRGSTPSSKVSHHEVGASPHKSSAPAKPPKLALEGKKWLVENYNDNKELSITDVSMNQSVYVFRCNGCTLQVKGKVNSVILDSCKKTALVLDSVISSVELVNCDRVQVQTLGTVPTIMIDKTDGCQIFLSDGYENTVVVSSKSSEMNVSVPDGQGEYKEYPIPEQFKTTIGPSGLTTNVAESTG